MRHLWMIVVVMTAFTVTNVDFANPADKSTVLKASSLLGKKVQDIDGKNLGDIKDLVIDPVDGSISYAVLDFGGFLGIGDKYFAVPWEALQLSKDQKAIVLDVSKKDLKQAPGFDKNNWPDLSNPAYAVIVYEYYGIAVPDNDEDTIIEPQP
jgi:sporulation protein YlmC with PRC-barrel domain